MDQIKRETIAMPHAEDCGLLYNNRRIDTRFKATQLSYVYLALNSKLCLVHQVII